MKESLIQALKIQLDSMILKPSGGIVVKLCYSCGSLSSSRRSCATDASAERSSSLSSLRRSSAAAAPTVRAYSSEHTVR